MFECINELIGIKNLKIFVEEPEEKKNITYFAPMSLGSYLTVVTGRLFDYEKEGYLLIEDGKDCWITDCKFVSEGTTQQISCKMYLNWLDKYAYNKS